MKNIDKFGKWVKQLSTLILSIPNMSAPIVSAAASRSTYNSVFRQFWNDPKVKEKLPRGNLTPGWPNTWRKWIKDYLISRTTSPVIIEFIRNTRNIFDDKYDEIIGMMIADYNQKNRMSIGASATGKYTIAFTLNYIKVAKEKKEDGTIGDTVNLVNVSQLVTDTLTYNPDKPISQGRAIKHAIAAYFRSKNNTDFDYEESETISVTGFTCVPAPKTDLGNIAMRGTPLAYDFLKKIGGVVFDGSKCCVIDYLFEQLEGKQYFKKLLKPDLINYFETTFSIDVTKEGITTNQIIQWAQEKKHVTVYAISPMMEVMKCHVAPDPRVTLVFIINNQHIYGVCSEEYINMVRANHKINLACFTFDIAEVDHVFTELEQAADIMAFEVPEGKRVVLTEQSNLMELAAAVINETNSLVVNTHFSGSPLSAFEHPISKVVYASAPNYKKRKAACDKLTELYGMKEFNFTNQTYRQIGSLLNTYINGPLPVSSYGPDLSIILNEFKLTPAIGRVTNHMVTGAAPVDEMLHDCSYLDDDYAPAVIKKSVAVSVEEVQQMRSLDVKSAFTGLLINNDTPYNVFNSFDEIRPFSGVPASGWTPGEYYLNRDVTLGNGTIPVLRCWYPLILICYLYNKGIITAADISFEIIASAHLPADYFAKFASVAHNELGDKNIVNSFTGGLNELSSKTSAGCVTNDFNTAMGVLYDEQYYGKAGIDTRVYSVNGLYFIRRDNKTPVCSGSSPIYRHIIAASYIMLDKLHAATCGPDSIVVAYNTDNIKVINAKPIELKAPEDLQPGDIREESIFMIRGNYLKDAEAHPPYVHKVLPITMVDRSFNGPVLVSGMPGSGKSTLLKNNFVEGNAIALTYTCKAKDVLVNMGCTNAHNLDSYFNKELTRSQMIAKGCKHDIICLDEYSMIPNKWFALFYEMLLQKKTLVFKMYGDKDQCIPIEEIGKWYDYSTSSLIRLLCGGNVCHLDYIPGCARFDIELKEVLEYMQKYQRIPESCADKVETKTYINICAKNDIRQAGNAECYARYIKEFPTHEIKRIGARAWCVGMPVINLHNYKKIGIYNGHLFNIVSFTDTNVVVKRLEDGKSFDIDHPKFIRSFDYGFYLTIMKFQGGCIKTDYNVFTEGMKLNDVYTAFSRGVSLSKVHFKYNGRVFNRAKPFPGSVLYKSAAAAKMGRLYKITVEGQEGSYYGCTKNFLLDRLEQHKTDGTSQKMIKWLAMGKPTIELISEFRILQDATMFREEAILIKKMASEGAILMNTMHNTPVKDAKPVIEQLEKIVILGTKPKVVDVPLRKKFRVRRMVDGVAVEKTFPYGKRPKQEAENEAKAYLKDLTGDDI